MGLLVIYLLTGWLLTLMKDADFSSPLPLTHRHVPDWWNIVERHYGGYCLDLASPALLVIGSPMCLRPVFSPSSALAAAGVDFGVAMTALVLRGRVLHQRRTDRPQRLRAGLLPDMARATGRKLECQASGVLEALSVPPFAGCLF